MPCKDYKEHYWCREYDVPMQPPPPPLPQAAFGGMVLPEKAMHPTNIRRAALALEAHAHTMPAQRRDHLTVSQGSLLQPYEDPQ